MPYDVEIIIGTNGSITTKPVNDNDYPHVREHILKFARAVGGDSPVVETECITPDEADAITRRLAEVLLGGRP